MTKIKAIISDADGTLVDTMYLIRHGQYETVKSYLTTHGIPPSEIPSYEQYEEHLHKALGGSARETLERTVALIYENKPDYLTDIDNNALHDLLNPIQDKIAPEYVKAYPGLYDLLSFMGREKINFAVFTSGTPHHVVRNFGISIPELGQTNFFLEKGIGDLDKLRMFETIMQDHFGIPCVTFVTCDDISATKPDPESVFVALDRLNVTKDEALILGDHWVDMKAGVNADVKMRVGVSHGFDDTEELIKAGATEVIGSLSELPGLLRG
ncbi:HAD hydrolase-like protein [Candidatus Woesebacteria bacterium]|nr:HAD hydrolase-like protein [Candidatus Woesebacteria bacterium]